MDVHFYMRGGHKITAYNVDSVELTRSTETGAYTGYNLIWKEGAKNPDLFSLSIPDIVGVVTEETYLPFSPIQPKN